MSTEDSAGQAMTRAARLPAPGEHGRQSLRADELASMAPQDRAAVEKLLALPALDEN